MPKKQNDRTTPTEGSASRGAMLVLVAGVIAVAALVGWALTRSVEPAIPEAATVAAPGTAPAQSPPPATAQTDAGTLGASAGVDPNTGVPRVSVQDLKAMVDRGSVTVIDVRDSVSYAQGHIPGAIHIPFSRVEGEARYLPKDKPIVAYCT